MNYLDKEPVTMKAQGDLSLNLRLASNPLERKEKLAIDLIKTILSSVLYLALTLYMLNMFHIEHVSFITIVFSFVPIASMYLIKRRNVQQMFIFGFLLLFIIFFSTQYRLIVNGFLLTVNQMNDVIGTHTGMIFPRYEVALDESSRTLAANLFWFIALLFVAFLSFLTVYAKKIYVMLLTVSFFAVIHLFTGISGTFIHSLLLLFSVLSIVSHSFLYRAEKERLHVSEGSIVYVSIIALVALVLVIFSMALNVMQPIADYQKSAFISSLEKTTKDVLDGLRFEKEQTNTFTHGDFTKLNELKLSDLTALEVIMDKPASMYLKGFVGAEYTPKGWLPLEPSVRYHSDGLFYWLNEKHFNVYNQLHHLFALTNESEAAENVANITIHNVNANSKYVYYPYELRTNPHEIEGVEMFADSHLLGESFLGERNYRYAITPRLVPRYPELANHLYALEDEEKVQDYLKHESHYNEFVYEHYTEIPDHIRLFMENLLDINVPDGNGHVNYEMAIHKIRTYLYDKIKYDTNVQTMPEGDDFLIYFLEESKAGFAAHYATAATVMFRHLGIPARYVEGFIITPDDVRNAEPYEKITLTGKNAHAWTEIYIDRIGWIPIEVTPPYLDKMEPIDLTHYPEGNGEQLEDFSTGELADDSEGVQEVFDEEQSNRNDLREEDPFNMMKFLLFLLVSAIVITVIVYVCYVYIKRREIHRLKQSFVEENCRDAVPKMFSYTMKLLHYHGIEQQNGTIASYVPLLKEQFSKDFAERFEQAVKINQKALYSDNTIQRDEYDIVKTFMEQTLTNVMASKNMFQKFKMKYVDFII